MFKNLNSFAFIFFVTVLVLIAAWLIRTDKKHNKDPDYSDYRTVEEIMQTPVKPVDNSNAFDTEFVSSIQPIKDKNGN